MLVRILPTLRNKQNNRGKRDMHKIIEVSIQEIAPTKENPRTHDKQQIEAIRDSIDRYGFLQPLVINKDKEIIVGHGRHQASLLSPHLASIPCIQVDNLSEEELKEYMVLDNKIHELGGYDETILNSLKNSLPNLRDRLSEIDDTLRDRIEEFKNRQKETERNHNGKDLDNIPEQAPSVVKRGDIWKLGSHRLMCGDSTNSEDVSLLMDGKKCDMVFTDPPYGVSYADKNEFLNNQDKGNCIQKEIINDHLTLDETASLWRDTFSVWSKYHAEKSTYYIASPQGGNLFLMMMMMNENNHPLRHCIIWNKNNHVLGRCDYMYKHETILYGWQHTHNFYGKGEHTKSVWDIPKPLKNDLHPTMKPIALVENAILNSTLKDMLVVDYFLGSGTTLIACENTNRICYGIELDEHYCDIIIKRWETLTGNKAIKV